MVGQPGKAPPAAPAHTISKRGNHHATQQLKECAIRMWKSNKRTWEHVEDTIRYDRRTMRGWVAEAAAEASRAELSSVGLGAALKPVQKARGGKLKLSAAAQAEVVRALNEDPCLYYDELMFLVYTRTNECVSKYTVRRVAIENGFKLKVVAPVSAHRNKHTMMLHAQLRTQYHWRQYLFVDEAHKRGRDMIRKKGKAQGNRKCFVPLSEHLSRSWTMVAAMNYTGLVAYRIQELGPIGGPLPHAINRQLWLDMFAAFILPHIGDARKKEPNSVVIIDNASLHWGSDGESTLNALHEMIKKKGGILVYTPPFCPRE